MKKYYCNGKKDYCDDDSKCNECEHFNGEGGADIEVEEMALTDVDILANDINQHCPDLEENYCGDTHCVACLANALTAKGYRKERQGEWIKVLTGFRCSLCNTHEARMTKFCPECGARMKGE